MRSEIQVPGGMKEKMEELSLLQAQLVSLNMRLEQVQAELVSHKMKAGLDNVTWELNENGKIFRVLSYDELEGEEIRDINKHNDRVLKSRAKMFLSL